MAVVDSSLDISRDRQHIAAAMPGDLPLLAHDIRGALQGVVGGVAALEISHLPDSMVEQVDRIAAASRSLESLIGMAIGDDSAHAGGEVVLADFIDYFRQRWVGEARAHDIEFRLLADADLPVGLAIPHMTLARILGNLTSNAIRHTGAGTVDVRVSRGSGGGVTFAIRDNGPGIPTEILDRVGIPSGAEVTDPTAMHGLGLCIVRSLSDEIGARLTLANIAGGGAEAVVDLPARLCIAADRGRGAKPAGDAERPDLTGLQILLAEDNPTNQMVATQMLNALGAEVSVASDGVEALEAFEAATFDLVVVDIEMPRLSGLDVIRRIRGRQDARARTPIVALTAYALREHRERIAEAGADGLISKPITSVDLLGRGLAAHVTRPTDAASVLPAPSDAVIDRATYDALSDAIGAEMMAELLGKVVSDLEDARASLAAALSPPDQEPIRAASHILISVAGAIGAKQLQDCARELNSAAHEPVDASMVSRAEQCIAEIDAALSFARDERAAL